MAKWKKQTLKLNKKHKWTAKPGHRIFVAGRGDVRFDIPQSWILKPDSDSIKFYDGEPPDDNCRMEVTWNRLPPTDWSTFPMETLLKSVIKGDKQETYFESDVVSIKRRDLRAVWMQYCSMDPVENRDAYTRILIGIGGNVQCLITLDFWPEDADRLAPVWDDVIETLQLGVYILDPTMGSPIAPHLN